MYAILDLRQIYLEYTQNEKLLSSIEPVHLMFCSTNTPIIADVNNWKDITKLFIANLSVGPLKSYESKLVDFIKTKIINYHNQMSEANTIVSTVQNEYYFTPINQTDYYINTRCKDCWQICFISKLLDYCRIDVRNIWIKCRINQDNTDNVLYQISLMCKELRILSDDLEQKKHELEIREREITDMIVNPNVPESLKSNEQDIKDINDCRNDNIVSKYVVEKTNPSHSHSCDNASRGGAIQEESENNQTLNKVLDECQEVSNKTYTVALAQTEKLKEALLTARQNMKQISECYDHDAQTNISRLIEEQLTDINRSLDKLSTDVRKDLEKLYANTSKFSVCVFGRTMAGKSTLMEILTQGKGQSIGRGAQRTTRDVRQYYWKGKGLAITDVPGVGAFDGNEDEIKAFNAAKTADLILYLISDDAPQPDTEAKWLKKINDLGKPVICIMNIKKSVKNKSPKILMSDVEKAFDMQRLEDIRTQFLKYAKEYGQSWENAPFFYVHLQLAFESQKQSDSTLTKHYYEKSRFDDLVQAIISQIETNGKFYRTKNYVDTMAIPMCTAFETFLKSNEISYSIIQIYQEKIKNLDSWKKDFNGRAIKEIELLIERVRNDLNYKMNEFINEHYEDNQADIAWANTLKDINLELTYNKLINNFSEQINNQLNEINRSFARQLDLRLSFFCDCSLKMDKIHDYKKWWKRFSILANGVSLFFGGWPKLIVGAVTFVGTKIFDDRKNKEVRAKSCLRNKLLINISTLCRDLSAMMRNQLDKMISHLNQILKDMEQSKKVLSDLATANSELSGKLMRQIMPMNLHLIKKALESIGFDNAYEAIFNVVRLPGYKILIVLQQYRVFPPLLIERLAEKMQVNINDILVVYHVDEPREMLTRIIQSDYPIGYIQRDVFGSYSFSMENNDPDVENRIRLAQMLLNVIIKKQNHK